MAWRTIGFVVGPDGLVRTADDLVSRYDLLDESGYSALPLPFFPLCARLFYYCSCPLQHRLLID